MTEQELQKRAADLLEKAKGASAHLSALSAHLGKMHKSHGAQIATAQDHVSKCIKALGGDKEESDWSDAGDAGAVEHTDPKAGSTGEGEAHAVHGKAFDPDKFAADLVEKLDKSIETKINEGLVAMAQAMFSTEGAAPVTKAVPGIGDRSLVAPNKGPVVTQPVGKTSDQSNGGPGAPGATAAPELSTDLYKKSLSGDQEARLAFARSIRTMNTSEANRVEQNTSMTQLRR